MKCDIILSGVGGQGILTIAAVIGRAALEEGLSVKQAEVHGMSQRGGDVQSHLRLNSENIYSDLIPKGMADLIISLEPLESLRYIPWLKPGGWIVTGSEAVVNIGNYPQIEAVYEALEKSGKVLLVDAETLARECGSPRSANILLLGAACFAIGLDPEAVKKAVAELFASKGEEVVSQNLAAFAAGQAQAQKALEDGKK